MISRLYGNYRGAGGVPPPDASPAYKAGKFHGCEYEFMEAGRDQRSHIHYKDVKRLEEDAEYREGWEDGYAICFEEGSRYLEMMPGGGTQG